MNPKEKAADRKAFSLPPGIDLARPLTGDAALAIALWNNSAFEAEVSALGLSRADLIDAGLIRNPNLWMLFPVLEKPFEMLLTAPIEALWQRKHRVAMSRVNLEQTAQGLVQRGLNLMRDVRLACAELAAADQRASLAEEAAKLRARIAELTERRLKAGDISEYDFKLTQIDARTFEDTAQRFARDADIARDRLRLLLGLRGDKTVLKIEPPPPPAAALPEWDDLVEKALTGRPDVRAAEIAVAAAGQRAKWERSRVFNLGVILSTKGFIGRGTMSSPGISADLPIFNRNQGLIARADAEVERAALQYLAQRDQVELEIREALGQLVQARESLERARDSLLPAVRESIQLAEKAYRDGDASYLNALETSRQLYDVELREAEALLSVRRAVAQLERAVGRKL